MRQRYVSGTVVIAIALLVAACGPGGEESGGAEARGESLQDFIPGFASFDPENAEEQFRQQERDAQEKIATCMAEQGFEYVPYVLNEEEIFFGGVDSQEEFVEQYGLGITYDILFEQPGFEDEELPPEIANDPNYAIREELSPEEGEAYDRVLYGEEPDIDFESMSEEEFDEFFQSFEPGGCYNTAFDDIFDQEASQAFYEQFGSDLEAMYQRVESDPRIADMEANWSACMLEEGYQFTDEQDASIFILRRLEEIGAISELDVDPEGFGYGYGGEHIEPGSAAYLAAEKILVEEIAIAKASMTCQGDVGEVFQEVFQEYEQAFIEENRAALEQFRDENG